MSDLDAAAITADLCRLVDAGADELASQHVVADVADRLGLGVDLLSEDLTMLRSAAGYPGEEVERSALHSLTVTRPGGPGPRLAFNGHVDVVPATAADWTSPPFTSRVAEGRVYGRGAADMKAGVVAALHAMAAVDRPPGDVVLHAVAGEEDGGIGAFATLRRDADFAGCVITEPTAGALVCATAGAATWRIVVRGRSAHGCRRHEGVSALERFLPIHAALQRLEAELNRDVTHPLLQPLTLPYPLSVGRVVTGDWASTVPDLLTAEGRLGIPIGRPIESVRAQFADVVRGAADDLGPPPEVSWTGGQFAPAETPTDAPLVRLVSECAGGPPLTAVPYGSDLRLYTGHGIPTVIYGPGSIEQGHAVDEWVAIDDVVRVARVLAEVAARFGG